jgi:dihydroflavonol-4-reductase
VNIFLTGATGFLGRPLTRALRRRGWAVTALVRDPAAPTARAVEQAGARLVPGNIVPAGPPAREALRRGMAGADVVFHNAGWYELGLPAARRPAMRAANVAGTETILGLAADLGVPKILYTSTTTALGDTGGALADEAFTRRQPPRSYYEQTKSEAHAIAGRFQAQGAPLVVVCPAQVIGPGDRAPLGDFARLYVRGLLPPTAWAPEGVFTFGHVDDVTEAMALAVERGQPGQTYILGGEPMAMRQMLAVWSETPGGFKPFIWLPRPMAGLTGRLAAPLLRLAGRRAFISPEVIDSSYVCFRYASARAERELGAVFRPAAQAWRDTLAAERAALGR